jgi:hypothetical protein
MRRSYGPTARIRLRDHDPRKPLDAGADRRTDLTIRCSEFPTVLHVFTW